MQHDSRVRWLCAALLLATSAPAAAVTRIAFDAEPNDAPHQAVAVALPAPREAVRLVGELGPEDQDAYRLVVDEDAAGRRFDLRLIGRGGALTRLDLFEMSELVDARGRIPEQLERRPDNILSLSATDGLRPVEARGLMFAPGVYLLAVSHSGGSGAYSVELDAADATSIRVLDALPEAEAPVALRAGQAIGIHVEPGEAWFAFEVPDGAGPSAWRIDYQTELGRSSQLRLVGPEGQDLIEIESADGGPLRRSGLLLAPGAYLLGSTAKQTGLRRIEVAASAPSPLDGLEVEPNDQAAAPIAFGQALRGRIEGTDQDRFEFTVDPDQAGRRFALTLTSAAETEYEFCLQPLPSGPKHCRRGSGGRVALDDIALVEGRYELSWHDRRRIETDWVLEWTLGELLSAGEEAEPNDDPLLAAALHERGFGRGRFVGAEIDHWRFSVHGEPELWRVQLQGEGLHELQLKDARGTVMSRQRAHGNERIRLDNQFLLPGEYLVLVQGTADGDYTVRLQSLGPPPPGMELEPNDEVANAGRLGFGLEGFGNLAEQNDIDRWRFDLLGTERVRITVTPPVDGRIDGELGVGDEASALALIQNLEGPLVWERVLPAGDYTISLKPRQVSDAEYRIRLERLDVLQPPADAEPNDSHVKAAAWPTDGVVVGRVGHVRGDVDWYLIDARPEAVELRFPEQSGLRFNLMADTGAPPDPKQNLLQRADGQLAAMLEPGIAYWLQVSGNGDYRIEAPALARTIEAAERLDPSLTWRLERAEIQAFSPWAQTLKAQLELVNPGSAERSVELDLHVTDARWRVLPAPESVTLGPGASRTLEFAIEIPADAVLKPSVQISARASDRLGAAAALAEITAAVEAAPVRPSFPWTVPEPLRGGINAAAARFGAEAVDSPNMTARQLEDVGRLFDGLARHGRWTGFTIPAPRGTGPEAWGQPTVRLAGDAPVPVRGVLLNPTSTYQTDRYLAEFAVDLSVDGETWREVLVDRLEPLAQEQAFVFDAPIAARYARLRPLGAAGGSPDSFGGVTLGEFKLVAERGWRPAPEPYNLADPANGGHLVRSAPPVGAGAFDQRLLLADDKAPSVRLAGDATVEVVLGFEHARAARLASLAIEPGEPAGNVAERVRLAVSGQSPSGPWQPLAEFELNGGAGAAALPKSGGVRYLKLEFEAAEGTRDLQLPERIVVLEAEGDSVLGEWGHLSWFGPLEQADPPRWNGGDGHPVNDSPASAVVLAEAEPQSGRALLGEYASHYRLQVPPERNRLELLLRGWPTLDAGARLLADDGTELVLSRLGPAERADQARYEAWVEPGSTLRLEVYEPPRSLIFSWDTSGSVGAWIPSIKRALNAYAADLRPGVDEVNMLPFGMNAPLLVGWQGHRLPLMRMMAGGMRLTDSSAAEATLAVAARALVGRPGKKGVILLTDAATSADPALWPALDAGRPQVFALKLTSEGAFSSNPPEEVDLMQDWAMVRGGHFDYVTGYASIARGYERASAWMRRPVEFEVEARFETVDDPAPARLSVLPPPDATALQGAVEIILDASGSMLKRMGGQRRIDVAKAAIRDAVTESLADGLPLALRVYGHREAGSCRTDLEIPAAPLDKTAFLSRVETIEAINLARTPIADSLAAVARDLAAVKGRKLVVLLTDGEETCDGDPAAAIRGLQEAGIDLRINIVGFALDDEALKQQFSDWAALGGGEYLDAGDADELGAALERALDVPFAVLDERGEVVARGQVGGDPVELPPGRYRLRVEGAQTRHIDDLTLAAGEQRELQLD